MQVCKFVFSFEQQNYRDMLKTEVEEIKLEESLYERVFGRDVKVGQLRRDIMIRWYVMCRAAPCRSTR